MSESPNLVSLSEHRADPDLVEFAEGLRGRLEAGEVTALAVAMVDRDGETRTAWAWEGGVDSARLLGGTVALQHRLARTLDPEAQ